MALTLGELSGVISLDDKPFTKSLDGAQGKLGDFGSKGKVIAAAAGVAIGAALAAGFAKSMDLEKGNDKLAASLGLNEAESAKAGKIAGSLYANAYGESMGEVNGAVEAVMSSIKGMRDGSSEDVQAMTAKVLDMAAAFEIDAGRAAQVAGQMITSGLAKDGVEAADLLTASLQKVPKAVREDVLDAVDEYGPFMKSLGITGEKAMGLLVKASEKGMYGIDKTGDALKEFGIRATDMSKATGGAYDAIGLDQQEMTNKLLAGGDTASEAFQTIVEGVQSITDPAARSQAALALFGTPLEDLSVTEIPKFLDSLKLTSGGLGDVAGAADDMGKTLNENAATNIETYKRGLSTLFVDLVGNRIIPILDEVVGGIKAFGAAWVANDGDITSSGFPGFMENVAYQARQAYDKMTGLGKSLYDLRVPIGVVAGLILTLLIPYWVRLGYVALESAAKQKLAWATTQTAAFKAAYTSMWATAIMVGGWLLMGTQATIQAVKIAASWLVAMGPVGWVILIVAGLVAAFVAAYNNIGWFRDGVDAAMKWVQGAIGAAFTWIQQVIGNVVDWFTNTAVPAWNNAIKAIGDFFTSLYTTWIKPVFDGIQAVIGAVVTWFTTTIVPGFQAAVAGVGAVFTGLYLFLKPVFESIGVIVNGFYLFFRGIFQLVASIITYVIVPLFTWFWNRMVEAFAAIGQTISDWWNGAVAVFNTVVGFIHDVLAAAFNWLLDSVIRPVWNAVSGAIKTAWTAISGVFNTVISFIRTTLSTAFTWFRDSVITPVWNGIRNAINGAWSFIRGIFDSIGKFLKDTLAPVFTWLRDNIIKPVFERIQNIIRNTWEQDIKPVFTALSDFIMKTIPKAFDDGVKFVKTAWDKLQDIAKAPVRFVVDTVINDGLIGAFNTIAGILPGIDKLPRVALPAGFANGGYTGDGGKYQPAGIVHAGEYVFTKEQTKRAGVGNLSAMAQSLTGYANGGRVAPLKHLAVTQGYNRVHKGIDYAAAEGTPVFATQNGTVSHAGPGARAPGVWGGNEIHIAGSGLETWFAHLSRIGVGLGQKVRAGQQIGLSGNTGISSGPHLHFGVFNGGWPNDLDPNSYLGGAGVPSGGSGGGFNPIAGIIDGLVSKFKDQFPGGGIFADMAIGIGKKILDGASKWVTDTLGGGDKKGNAAGPTVYDGGGWLENTGGPQLVQHNKSRPDAVLSDQQWADIHKLALGNAGGGMNYAPTYQWMGDDPHEVMRKDKARAMDLLNAYT
jgi:murein DD-endopeptidase MepM/ murein hydrolase activator NlpD/phage-related minor tail protein